MLFFREVFFFFLLARDLISLVFFSLRFLNTFWLSMHVIIFKMLWQHFFLHFLSFIFVMLFTSIFVASLIPSSLHSLWFLTHYNIISCCFFLLFTDPTWLISLWFVVCSDRGRADWIVFYVLSVGCTTCVERATCQCIYCDSTQYLHTWWNVLELWCKIQSFDLETTKNIKYTLII